jgi:hypothetical protein
LEEAGRFIFKKKLSDSFIRRRREVEDAASIQSANYPQNHVDLVNRGAGKKWQRNLPDKQRNKNVTF